MILGDYEILPVWDGLTSEAAADMLAIPGLDDPWRLYPEAVDKRGRLNFVIGGFLIKGPCGNTLVDLGVGRVNSGQHNGGHFIDSLAGLGVSTEAVEHVLFSHLHFDHVGWATQQGGIVFPNADYACHRLDWARFVEAEDAQPAARRKLLPLLPRLTLFDADHEVLPGVFTRHCPGHTPGHTSFQLRSRGQTAYLLNDTLHSPAEIADPRFVPLMDEDPGLSMRSRENMLREIETAGALMVASHFPGMRFGHVRTTPQGRRFVPACTA